MTMESAVRAVLVGTVVAGVVGSGLGALLARAAPRFFEAHGSASPVESGLALGGIAGLVIGSAGCVLLAAVKIRADATVEAKRRGPDDA